MTVGRLGRIKPGPEAKRVDPVPPASTAAVPTTASVEEEPPTGKRGVFIAPRLSPEITDAKLREFLDLPALVN